MDNSIEVGAASAGAVHGGVRSLLRLEGLAIMAAATAAFFLSGANPWLYALLFFAPDLSFAAYAINPRIGAAAYNAVHSYVFPLALGGLGWLVGLDLLWQVALILVSHAGFDRSLGYGLKYASGFHQTHLGTVGRANAPSDLAPRP